MRMFYRSVAQALKLTGGPGAEGTAKFIEMADNFFDCLNVDNLNEGKEKRKKFREPYTSADDKRLKVHHRNVLPMLILIRNCVQNSAWH